jgi:hypothetical protein
MTDSITSSCLIPEVHLYRLQRVYLLLPPLLQGNYYYVVTTLENGVEETSITVGLNALEDPIAEIVEEPQPIFQQSRLVGDRPIDIYATFASMKYAVDSPLMNKAGFITNDFAVYRNGAVSGQHPLRLRFMEVALISFTM